MKSYFFNESIQATNRVTTLATTDDENLKDFGFRKRVLWILQEFSKANISRSDAQRHIKTMTNLLLQKHYPIVENKSVVLIPILRSGIAMWHAANKYFPNSESCFPVCHKDKGSEKVTVVWPANPELQGKKIIILDTVSATGDTIVSLCNVIKSKNPQKDLDIHVLSCYVSPTAIEKLLSVKSINKIHCAVISRSVDSNGYLIPKTNGDAGDKLYGKKNLDYIDELNESNTTNKSTETIPRSKL